MKKAPEGFSSFAEATVSGCRCVLFGESNRHWPCKLHGNQSNRIMFSKSYEPNWSKSPPSATHFNPIRGYPDWYKLDGFTVWAFVAGQWMESGSFERFEFDIRDLSPRSNSIIAKAQQGV